MIKAKSLILKDFQAHKSLKVPFSRSITSIVGPSDRGKSAILRALRWVCLNDFAGDEFIREGATRALVRLRTRRHAILRKKGAEGNIYALDEERFRAFGTSVPEPIAKLLQLSEVNFQDQHDAPFWFALSAGEVSRRLNAIIDLSVIDTSLSNAAGAVKKASWEAAISRERIQEKETQLEQVRPMKARVREFRELKTLRKEYRQLKRSWETLDSLVISIRNTLMWTRPPPDFKPVEELAEEARRMAARPELLEDLLEQIRDIVSVVNLRRVEAKGLEEMFHEKIKGSKCPTCGQVIQ